VKRFLGSFTSNGSRAPPSCGSICGRSGENRQRHTPRRDRAGRRRSDLDRSRREHWIERQFRQCAVEGNELIIGTIAIGAKAYIGSSCVIEENVVIEEGAEIGDLTPSARAAASAPGKSGMARRGARRAWSIAPRWTRAGCVRRAPDCHGDHVYDLAAGDSPLGLLPIFPAFWVFDGSTI